MSDILSAEQFEREPSVSIGRSTFTGLSHGLKTDLTQGKLCPIFCEEVLAGDTFQVKTSYVCRMATPVFPVMDNAVLDVWYFYVPFRLVWDKFREFLGENTTAPWVQTVEYTVPQLKFVYPFPIDSDNHLAVIRRGGLMNRLGVPTTMLPGKGTSDPLSSGNYLSVSDLPNRAVRLIWNEFFRDENVEYPVPVYTDSSDRFYAYPNSDGGFNFYGDELLPLNRLHDYFSSCLPGPQKSLTPVPASLLVDKIPVYACKDRLIYDTSGSIPSDLTQLQFAYGSGSPTTWTYNSFGNSNLLYTDASNKLRGESVSPEGNTYPFTPNNLFADSSGVTFATVDSLRQSFAIQRYYEQLARTGSRYREILKGFWNVESPDVSVQVPEYLGGNRVPINIDQVLQTSATDSVTPQGNTAGYSLTTDSEGNFIKSFTEPGYVIGFAGVRVQHTYSGQCRPMWFRKRRFDFYWPQFANLSEQPVYKKYLNTTGVSSIDNSVFGYQEAWADYRYCPNMLSGVFSPECFAILDSDSHLVITERQSAEAGAWTFADHYTMDYQSGYDYSQTSAFDPQYVESVSLSPEWMQESDVNVGQTLAVQNEPQFIADFWFDVKTTRPMPVRSIPGLIDHH